MGGGILDASRQVSRQHGAYRESPDLQRAINVSVGRGGSGGAAAHSKSLPPCSTLTLGSLGSRGSLVTHSVVQAPEKISLKLLPLSSAFVGRLLHGDRRTLTTLAQSSSLFTRSSSVLSVTLISYRDIRSAQSQPHGSVRAVRGGNKYILVSVPGRCRIPGSQLPARIAQLPGPRRNPMFETEASALVSLVFPLDRGVF